MDRSGQNGWLSFAGVSGERSGLEIYNHTTLPACSVDNCVVYKPDGTLLTSTNLSSNRVHLLPLLPASGTYRIRVSSTYALPYAVGLTLK